MRFFAASSRAQHIALPLFNLLRFCYYRRVERALYLPRRVFCFCIMICDLVSVLNACVELKLFQKFTSTQSGDSA